MLMSEINYSIALRCIGQDLERRGLKTFNIRRDGNHFVVFPDNAASPAAPREMIRYTPSDLEMMDRCGEIQRGNQADQEFFHRTQRLRAIGDYLDKYGSTLISISYGDVERAQPEFRVEYITREGEHLIDDRADAAIFDECVLMFQKRSQGDGTSSRAARRQN
jgi:hypothetical protein